MAETKKYVRIKTASVDGVWYADKIGQIFEVVRENSVAILTKCGGHHSVLREDVEVIVTEKRKAAVGERVLVTNAEQRLYKNGDEFIVIDSSPCGNLVYLRKLPHESLGVLWSLRHHEYVVVIKYEGSERL
ncbi:hypothetical protein [Bacillus sp. LR_5]|uniref:hypothetical protein n=1 Tax=Bacillus sp. LR_5 TaxID=3055784 RepID=UPI00364BC372